MAPLTVPQEAWNDEQVNWLGEVAVGAIGAVVLAAITLEFPLVLQPLLERTR